MQPSVGHHWCGSLAGKHAWIARKNFRRRFAGNGFPFFCYGKHILELSTAKRCYSSLLEAGGDWKSPRVERCEAQKPRAAP